MFYEWKYFIPGSLNDISAKKLVCAENILYFLERKHIWYYFSAKIEQKDTKPLC